MWDLCRPRQVTNGQSQIRSHYDSRQTRRPIINLLMFGVRSRGPKVGTMSSHALEIPTEGLAASLRISASVRSDYRFRAIEVRRVRNGFTAQEGGGSGGN